MGKVIMSGIVPLKVTPLAVGTTWLITEDGTWECPCTGNYSIELHGGGGGGVYKYSSSMYYCAGGGGSGEIYTTTYTEGDVISATIGVGGTGAVSTTTTIVAAGTGSTTTFGDLSVAGGGGAAASRNSSTVGSASGSLASAGTKSSTFAATNAVGGEGNISNTEQTYGDGGSGTSSIVTNNNGQSGAIIITYLGKAITLNISVSDSAGQESRFLTELGTLTIGGVQINNISQEITVPPGDIIISYTLNTKISLARTVAVNGTTIGVVQNSGTTVSSTINITNNQNISITMTA